jgi:hypothetical protein
MNDPADAGSLGTFLKRREEVLELGIPRRSRAEVRRKIQLDRPGRRHVRMRRAKEALLNLLAKWRLSHQ